jgi:MFS family permease
MKDSPAAAFHSRDFRLYQIARLLVIVGAQSQSVAVAWQVYLITHSALALGYTGLALFLPGPIFMLAAGHIADRFDRRNVVLVCYVLQTLCSGWLLMLSLHGSRNVSYIYAVLFLIGSGRAFSAPASSALVPHLVPKKDFVNAITWGANIFQTANIVGPAIGGVLLTFPAIFGLHGPTLVYAFCLLTLIAFIALVGSLRVRIGRMEKRSFSLDILLAGFRYVWKARIILGTISLDLFAVLLGGATALMPIFAADILHTGPRGLGILRAAPAAGALTVSFAMMWWPLKRHAGKIMLWCVALFGASTIWFGLSRNLVTSVIALLIVGGSDMISVVIRSSVIQLATPVEMRGRVSAVNSVFIGASNEFGEFESGLTAHWWGAVRAVVFGGIGSIAITGIWAVMFPSLRRADRMTTDELLIKETEAAEEPVY